MSDKEVEIEDRILDVSNKHHGDINKDEFFDCENNCPYCNDEKICIKPQYILPVYEDIGQADIYKNYMCLLCGKEFWEAWYACEEDYCYPDDQNYYFDEFGDYTDAYYHEHFDAYCQSFQQAIESGNLEEVASYKYTMIDLPLYAERKRISELRNKYNYPIYRRLTPEIVDLFEPGPIESRFEILDFGPDDIIDDSFYYFPRSK